MFVVFGRSQKHAPSPDAREAVATTSATRLVSPATTPAGAPTTQRPGSKNKPPTLIPISPPNTSRVPSGTDAQPTAISIPSIDVKSDLMLLGLNADRTIQTPPLSRVRTAGWYKYSPVPGALGPSVVLGHIDSAVYGKGIFYRLGAMKRGDSISVTRTDHMVAVFKVDKVVQYPKKSFPTRVVYGDTTNPQIRLITCGGKFDSNARSYLDNIIVFGSLMSLHHS